jgi:hypothetical protein
MSVLKLKDPNGGTVLLNNGPGPWTHIAAAIDANTKAPLLGFSVVFVNCPAPNNAMLVKGSPDEIYEMMQRQEIMSPLEMAQ